MKHIFWILFLVAFIPGCATAIPYTYQEECALKGMTLTGVSSGSYSGAGIAWGKNGATTIESNGYAESVSCQMPRTKAEACEISRLQQIAAPKSEYNQDIMAKKLVIGVGYYMIIAPGVVMKIVYDSQRNSAIEQSRKIASQTVEMCNENVQ